MKKTYFQYFLSMILYGSNGVVIHHILLSSHKIVLYRTLIGGLFLIAIFLFQRKKHPSEKMGILNIPKKQALCLLISGASIGTSWIFLYEAYNYIGVGVATLVYYCGPIFVMLLSPLLFHEKITGKKALGFGLVLMGMVFLNGDSLIQGGLSKGLLFSLIAALLFAGMVIFSKKASDVSGLENSMYQIIVSFLTVTIYAFLREPSHSLFDGMWSDLSANLIPLLILGVINTGVANYLYFCAIPKLPVQTVSACSYLEPLSALIFSVLLLQEQLSPIQAVGAVCILGGSILDECLSTLRHRHPHLQRTALRHRVFIR